MSQRIVTIELDRLPSDLQRAPELSLCDRCGREVINALRGDVPGEPITLEPLPSRGGKLAILGFCGRGNDSKMWPIVWDAQKLMELPRWDQVVEWAREKRWQEHSTLCRVAEPLSQPGLIRFSDRLNNERDDHVRLTFDGLSDVARVVFALLIVDADAKNISTVSHEHMASLLPEHAGAIGRAIAELVACKLIRAELPSHNSPGWYEIVQPLPDDVASDAKVLIKHLTVLRQASKRRRGSDSQGVAERLHKLNDYAQTAFGFRISSLRPCSNYPSRRAAFDLEYLNFGNLLQCSLYGSHVGPQIAGPSYKTRNAWKPTFEFDRGMAKWIATALTWVLDGGHAPFQLPPGGRPGSR